MKAVSTWVGFLVALHLTTAFDCGFVPDIFQDADTYLDPKDTAYVETFGTSASCAGDADENGPELYAATLIYTRPQDGLRASQATTTYLSAPSQSASHIAFRFDEVPFTSIGNGGVATVVYSYSNQKSKGSRTVALRQHFTNTVTTLPATTTTEVVTTTTTLTIFNKRLHTITTTVPANAVSTVTSTMYPPLHTVDIGKIITQIVSPICQPTPGTDGAPQGNKQGSKFYETFQTAAGPRRTIHSATSVAVVTSTVTSVSRPKFITRTVTAARPAGEKATATVTVTGAGKTVTRVHTYTATVNRLPAYLPACTAESVTAGGPRLEVQVKVAKVRQKGH